MNVKQLCAVTLVLCFAGLPAYAKGRALDKRAVAALTAKKSDARASAVMKLGKSKNKKARPLIEKRLKDKSPDVRAAAADALAALGDPKAIAALQGAAEDPAPYVARQVEAAISVLSGNNGEVGPPALVIELPADSTGKVGVRLREQLQHGVSRALEANPRLNVRVTREPARTGYAVTMRLRNAKQSRQGDINVVTVQCEMTLVALPARSLRMQSSTTAGGGFEGKIDKVMEQSLLADGVTQCIPEIADDVADYVIARAAHAR